MVVHEVQSDWAEGGSKYGVASEAKEAEYRAEQQELRDAEQQFNDTFPELRDAIADYMNNSDYYISDLNTWYLDLGYNEKLAAQMDRPHPNPNISYSDWSGHKALLDSAIFDENGNAVKPNADNFVILPYAGQPALSPTTSCTGNTETHTTPSRSVARNIMRNSRAGFIRPPVSSQSS